MVRLAPPREEEDRSRSQSRRPSLARERRRQTTSRTTNTGRTIQNLAAGNGEKRKLASEARIRRVEGAVKQEGKKSELSTI
jgi:hypothetical protein